MKKVLIKDIIIPAGTVFMDAPTRSERSGGHVQATIGLTKDSCGFITYCLDDDSEKLKEWFVDLKGIR